MEGSSKESSSSDTWKCRSCTGDNESQFENCKVCSTTRPAPRNSTNIYLLGYQHSGKSLFGNAWMHYLRYVQNKQDVWKDTFPVGSRADCGTIVMLQGGVVSNSDKHAFRVFDLVGIQFASDKSDAYALTDLDKSYIQALFSGDNGLKTGVKFGYKNQNELGKFLDKIPTGNLSDSDACPIYNKPDIFFLVVAAYQFEPTADKGYFWDDYKVNSAKTIFITAVIRYITELMQDERVYVIVTNVDSVKEQGCLKAIKSTLCNQALENRIYYFNGATAVKGKGFGLENLSELNRLYKTIREKRGLSPVTLP